MIKKLTSRINQVNSLLCVGLDSDFNKLPARFKKQKFPQFEFNKWIIEQTHGFVCAFKPNVAFYEARGSVGWRELEMTMEYLTANHPDIFTICDAKRGDIGSTNQGYVQAIFDQMNFDAMTVNPYVGAEGLQPFLDRKDKVTIILCHTSNPGAGELQEVKLASRKPVWQLVAEKVTQQWNKNHNCMLVVGATYPEEMKQVRAIAGEMFFLVPGIGTQGGDLKSVLQNGLNEKGSGLIINSSRGIIFSDHPQTEAEKLVIAMREKK